MSAKKPTIATAEKRVIRAELATLKKAAARVVADFRREKQAVWDRWKKADREVHKFQARAAKQQPRQLAAIDKRIAILTGRLGL